MRIWSLFRATKKLKEHVPRFLLPQVTICPYSRLDQQLAASAFHSGVVIRGRPRPLRGMSMSSEGT